MTGQLHHYPYEPRLDRPADLRRQASEARRAHQARDARREQARREEAEGRVRRLRARFVRAA